MSLEELKPCPFCGSVLDLEKNTIGHVYCLECRQTPGEARSIKIWNNAYCWQQLSRSEELNREMCELLSDGAANISDEAVNSWKARVKEMGK